MKKKVRNNVIPIKGAPVFSLGGGTDEDLYLSLYSETEWQGKNIKKIVYHSTGRNMTASDCILLSRLLLEAADYLEAKGDK